MNKKPLVLKDYLFISLICVLFGIIYLLAVYAGAAVTALLTPTGFGILGYEPFYGIWFMAPIFTIYVIRKPMVGVITEIVAALIEVLLGNMFGIMVIVSAFIQGLGIESGYAIGKYKDYSYTSACLAAIGATVFSFLWTGFRSNYLAMDLGLVFLIFSIRLVSALVFTGVLSPFICKKLEASKVLKVRG